MASNPNSTIPVFACFKCNYESKEMANFRKHLDSAHPRDNSYWCKNCGKGFADRQPYFDHTEKSDCFPLYNHPCGFEDCNFTDKDPTRYIFHLKNIHRGKPLLPCKYCKRQFTIPFCLLIHLQDECCNRPNALMNASAQSKTELKAVSNVTKAAADTSTPKSKTQHKAGYPESNVPTSTSNTKSKKAEAAPAASVSKASTVSSSSIWLQHATFSKGRTHRSLFDERDSDSDPEDPSWQPENLDEQMHLGYAKKISDNLDKESCKRSSTNSTLKHAKKVKPSVDYSNKSDPMIEDWTHWESKITGYKSPDVLQELLLASNICDFFKCMATACSFSTNDQISFSIHIQKEHKKEVLICCYCFTKILSYDILVKHMVAEHRNRKHQCSACLYRGCSKNHVKIHQQGMHAGEQSLAILRCQAVLGPADYQYIDQKIEDPKIVKHFKCKSAKNDCTFTTSITEEFKDHFLNEHAREIIFSCCYCVYESTSIDILLSHFQKHGLYEYECTFCDFGAEKTQNVVQHLCMNHADKPLQISSRQPPQPPQEVSEKNSQKSTQPNVREQDDTYSNELNNSTWDDYTESPRRMPRLNPIIDKRQGHSKISITESSDNSCPMDTSKPTKEHTGRSQTYPTMSDNLQNVNDLEKTVEYKSQIGASSNIGSDYDKIADVTIVGKKLKWRSERNEKYYCATCDASFNSYNNTLSHAEKVHNIINRFKCPHCEFTSNDSCSIFTHAKSEHTTRIVSIINLAIRQDNTDNKSIEPTKKNKTTLTTESFKNDSTLFCIFCSVSFNDCSTLMEHLRSELDYHKYVCKMCNFRNHNRSAIQLHYKNKHDTLLPEIVEEFDTVLEKWIKDYVHAQKMKQGGHDSFVPSRLQVNVKNFQCKICSLRLDSEKLLKEHLFQHLQYFPYRCVLCRDRFSTLDELDDHHKTLHSNSDKTKFWNYESIPKLENYISTFYKKCPNSQDGHLLNRDRPSPMSKKKIGFHSLTTSSETFNINPDTETLPKSKTTARKSVYKNEPPNLMKVVGKHGDHTDNLATKHLLIKKTARKSVSKLFKPSKPTVISPVKASNLTAGEPKVKAPTTTPNAGEGVNSAPIPDSDMRENAGTSSYGKKPSPVDWKSIIVYSRSIGCNLNGTLIKEKFEKQVRVKLADTIKQGLLL